MIVFTTVSTKRQFFLFAILMVGFSAFVFSQTQNNQTSTQTPNQTEGRQNVQQQLVSPYTLYKQGKYRAAVTRAAQVISNDKQNISAYAVQGWSYLSLGQWRNALNTSLVAYRFNKNDRRIIQIIGEANYELGKYENAMTYFNRYLSIAPNGQLTGWVYYFIGLIYDSQNKFYKADIALSTAVYEEKKASRVPRVTWLLALAKVQTTQQKLEKAIETYRYILSIDKNNTQAKQILLKLTT